MLLKFRAKEQSLAHKHAIRATLLFSLRKCRSITLVQLPSMTSVQDKSDLVSQCGPKQSFCQRTPGPGINSLSLHCLPTSTEIKVIYCKPVLKSTLCVVL